MTVQPVVPLWAWVPLAAAAVLGCAWLGWRRGRRAATLRRSLAVALLAVIALRPGTTDAAATAVTNDLDVWFVVDRTASMVAEDHDGTATRLEGAKRDLLAIATALPGARFALVGYDNDVVDLMPLTTDVEALAVAIDVLHPEVTAYSTGSSPRLPAEPLRRRLAAAAEQDPQRRRAVVLVSDGEATAADPIDDPFTPIAELVDDGVVLGYGTVAGGRMREWSGATADPTAAYVQDPATGGDAVSRIDELTLRAIADEMGVDYVHRRRPGDLDEVADGLGAGRETDAGDGPLRAADDRGWPLAWPLLALVLVELALASSALARSRSLGLLGRPS